jgi:hypothetical protein
MKRYTRITVPLGEDEHYALLKAAMSNYRHPRDQARMILRQVLIGQAKVEGNGRRLDNEPATLAANA